MATRRDDPRVLAAVNGAMNTAYRHLGRRGGDWVWDTVYPAFRGQAWCGAYMVMIYRSVGVDLMKCAWWYYVPYVRNFAAKQGFLRSESSYGWMPLFDWHGDGIMDHIGASNPDMASSLFRSVEGNTSPGNYGSQDNGNGVYERYREGEDINAWVDIHAVLAWMIDTGKWDGRVSGRSIDQVKSARPEYNDLNPNGYGEEYVMHVQRRLVAHGYDIGPEGVDGVLGWKTYGAVGRFQADRGLVKDHIPGPITMRYLDAEPGRNPQSRYVDIRALQRAVGAADDNVGGPDTRKRLDAVRAASEWGGESFPHGVTFAQRVVGTEPDGIWGDISRECHDSTVEDIQRALNALGYGLKIDGVYGPLTDAAVWDAVAKSEQP